MSTQPDELETILDNVFNQLEISEAGLLHEENEHRHALKKSLLAWREQYASVRVLNELLGIQIRLGLSSHPVEGLIVYPYVTERIAELSKDTK